MPKSPPPQVVAEHFPPHPVIPGPLPPSLPLELPSGLGRGVVVVVIRGDLREDSVWVPAPWLELMAMSGSHGMCQEGQPQSSCWSSGKGGGKASRNKENKVIIKLLGFCGHPVSVPSCSPGKYSLKLGDRELGQRARVRGGMYILLNCDKCYKKN